MARIYLEGGGDSKDLHSRCREGFRKLLERAGLAGRMPRLVACGGRGAAFDDFRTAHQTADGAYTALLIDSEEPVLHVEQPWVHLQSRDGWERPAGAADDQAFLMTTSMETWIVSDPAAERKRFGPKARVEVLPPVLGIEAMGKATVLAALRRATESCPVIYSKGIVSFEVLGTLSPATLMALPSFARMHRVLGTRL